MSYNGSPVIGKLKWEDPKELSDDIDMYFSVCEQNEDLPTLAGLARHLKTHRDTIWDYRNMVITDEELSEISDKEKKYRTIIKRSCSDLLKDATNRIEEAWIKFGAHDKNQVFAIFYLKAGLGYRETECNESNLKLPNLIINVLPSKDKAPILLDKTQFVIDANVMSKNESTLKVSKQPSKNIKNQVNNYLPNMKT